MHVDVFICGTFLGLKRLVDQVICMSTTAAIDNEKPWLKERNQDKPFQNKKKMSLSHLTRSFPIQPVPQWDKIWLCEMARMKIQH